MNKDGKVIWCASLRNCSCAFEHQHQPCKISIKVPFSKIKKKFEISDDKEFSVDGDEFINDPFLP